MATATDLITRALRRARAIGRDQVVAAEDSADGLTSLNALLDVWWNERLAVFYVLREQLTLTAGQASRTIGSGGNFNTTRPVKVLDSYTRRNNVDTPLRVVDQTEYDAIPDKTVQGIPRWMYYNPTPTIGTLYFYPVPDQADALFLNSYARLQSLAALNTSVTLPPGYDQLVVDGLAIQLAPEYGREAPPDVKRSFARTMRVLKRVNAPAPVMSMPGELLPRTGGYNINVE